MHTKNLPLKNLFHHSETNLDHQKFQNSFDDLSRKGAPTDLESMEIQGSPGQTLSVTSFLITLITRKSLIAILECFTDIKPNTR